MRNNFWMLLISNVAICGCSSIALRPEAAKIKILLADPKGCEYLGEATGSQGNFFTGDFTSNSNLESGARIDMKNKAATMGGNAIVLLTNRAGQTGSVGQYGGGISQTNVVYTGAVYKCPPGEQFLPPQQKPGQ